MTTTLRTNALMVAAIATLLTAAVPATHAGLFASLAYNNSLAVFEPGTPHSSSVSIAGSTVPFQQTKSLTLPNVAGSATYAFTDDGTTAALRFTCLGQLFVTNSEVGEGANTGSQPVEAFTLAQPASYVVTFTDTGVSSTAVAFITGSSEFDFNLSGTGTMTKYGTVPAGLNVDLLEQWNFTNENGSAPATASGSESLSIVFTAVPEPASAAGPAVAGGAALLARRRRHGR